MFIIMQVLCYKQGDAESDRCGMVAAYFPAQASACLRDQNVTPFWQGLSLFGNFSHVGAGPNALGD